MAGTNRHLSFEAQLQQSPVLLRRDPDPPAQQPNREPPIRRDAILPKPRRPRQPLPDAKVPSTCLDLDAG